MKKVFRKEHVGQRVTSALHGKGVITEVNETNDFAVKALFSESYDDNEAKFTQDGWGEDTSYTPILAFGWDNLPEWDYREPKAVYRPFILKNGETAWCYVGDDEEEVLKQDCKRLVVAATSKVYLAIEDEYFKHNQPMTTITYKYAMRCSELD